VKRLAVGIILALACFCQTVEAQGVLEAVRESVRSDRDDSSRPRESASATTFDTNSDGLMRLLLMLPVAVPQIITGDNGDMFEFTSYPYSTTDAYLKPLGDKAPDRVPTFFGLTERSAAWSVRAAIEDGDDFRRINRFGGSLAVLADRRINLFTDWKGVVERLPGGRTDGMVFGDANIAYAFAEDEKLQVYAGLGLRTLSDSGRTDLGGQAIYGFDWFPCKPLVASARLDLGVLGNAVLLESRATVGILFRNVETFVGYDYLLIDRNAVQGMVGGVRFWF
jgi:hypothetical protein